MTLKITLKNQSNSENWESRTNDMSDAENFHEWLTFLDSYNNRQISVWLKRTFLCDYLVNVVSVVFQCGWTFQCDFQCHSDTLLDKIFVCVHIIFRWTCNLFLISNNQDSQLWSILHSTCRAVYCSRSTVIVCSVVPATPANHRHVGCINLYDIRCCHVVYHWSTDGE